jgi:hypothetical protein
MGYDGVAKSSETIASPNSKRNVLLKSLISLSGRT